MRNGANMLIKYSLIILALLVMKTQTKADAGEEYTIIEKDHKKGLINKKGRVLIPIEYDDLGWTNGGTRLLENVIGFKKNGLWGILNTKNEKVTEPIYRSLTRFNDNWIVASKKLPYNSDIVFGIINAKGNAEIAFKYHRLFIHQNQMIASVSQDGKFLYGILDNKAKPLVPIRYDEIKVLSENLYEVTNNDLVAVFNHKGEGITKFTLDSVNIIEPGFVLTFQNGKRGLITNGGNFIMKPAYKNIVIKEGKIKAQKFPVWQSFDNTNHLLATYAYDDMEPKGEGLYKVTVGEAQALIQQSDSLLTPFSDFEIQEQFGSWIFVEKDEKSGVYHFDGNIFLEPIYDSIRYVKDVFFVRYKINGQRGWSIINHHGEVITDQVYDKIEWLGDSYFKVKRDNYWGVVNSLGREIIFCKYDSIVQYTQGKLLVEFLGEDGILNLNGDWEILPQKKDIEIVDPLRYLIRSPYGSYVAYYPDTKDFTAEYFLYKHGDRYLEKTLDNKYGLLDEYGKRVIKPAFDEISELQEDSIYFAKSKLGHSFITKSGKMKVTDDNRFEAINNMSEEFIGVKINDSWGFVDINGKLRISNQYENVGPYNEGLAPIKILGRWGYINKREDIIVQPTYDTVYSFTSGMCEVVKKGFFGLINAQGKITLDCEYDSLYRLKTGGFLTFKNNKSGLASSEGRLLVLPRFDNLIDLGNGFVINSRNHKFGLMSNEGVSIIPMIYDNLKYDKYNDVYLASSNSEWVNIEFP